MLVRVELVLIFLVIIAGSVVRMTGSGMGCPDWPQCFGYVIPPTERSTLEWSPDQDYQKGQMIILDEALYRAREDFRSGEDYQPAHWEEYRVHDYAEFNPRHTWIEYINRLLGALSGLPMLGLVILGGFYYRRDRRPLLLALAGLFMLGFEAWLGKRVVDANLLPGSITIHMMGALAILAILLLLGGILRRDSYPLTYYTRLFRLLLIGSLLLTIIQIVMGTQVREWVDTYLRMEMARSDWLSHAELNFYVHRSFSILVLAVNLWLWWHNRQHQLHFRQLGGVMSLILAEIALGIILTYAGLPPWAQPLHLLLAAGLFALQWQMIVQLYLSQSKQVVPVE